MPMALLAYGYDIASFLDLIPDDDDYDTMMSDLKPYRCEIIDYLDAGSEWASMILVIKESQKTVDLGELLELGKLEVGKDWDQRIRDYAERRRIPRGSPGWLLVCVE